MNSQRPGTRHVGRLGRSSDFASERASSRRSSLSARVRRRWPTLEIFSYGQLVEGKMPTANQCGFAHIAFAVDDVNQALQALIAAGGGAVGEIATTEVDSVGVLRVVYARDPEGNIIELQKWN